MGSPQGWKDARKNGRPALSLVISAHEWWERMMAHSTRSAIVLRDTHHSVGLPRGMYGEAGATTQTPRLLYGSKSSGYRAWMTPWEQESGRVECIEGFGIRGDGG